jgi:site-specific DNA-cytosine methylase
MLDLFCGLGGASRAMRERGWDVFGVDIDPAFDPEICEDMTRFEFSSERRVDFLWASPPCDEFSREFMPWSKTGVAPSLDLVRAVARIVKEVNPRFWCLENTRGSVKWISTVLGRPVTHCGGGRIYLWGNHPPMLYPQIAGWKEKLSSTRAAERGKMPYELSLAFAVAVERAASNAATTQPAPSGGGRG